MPLFHPAIFLITLMLLWSPERVYAGLVLVTSQHTNEIRRYDTTSGALVDVFANVGFDNPIGLTIGPDGSLFAANYGSSQVTRYDGITGSYLGVFATGSGMSGPQGLIFRDHDLFVSSRDSDSILRYDGVGNFLGAFVTVGSGGLYRPNGLGFGADGNLYVSSQASNQILKYNGTTGAFLSIFTTIPDNPHGLAFDGLGNLYIGNAVGETFRLDATTGAIIQQFHSGGQYLAIGLDGLLYDSAGTSSISRYSPATGTYVDTPISDPGLNTPAGFAFQPTPVPEPGGLVLLGSGILVLPLLFRRILRMPSRIDVFDS